MRAVFVLDKDPVQYPSHVGRAALQVAQSAAKRLDVRLFTQGNPTPIEGVDVVGCSSSPGRRLADYRRLVQDLAPEDVLVVWGTSSWPSILLPALTRRLGARLVHVPAGYYPFHVQTSGWTRALYAATQRRILRACVALLAQSDEEVLDAHQFLPRAPARLLPLGHDGAATRRLAHAGRDAAAEADLPERYALVLGPDLPNRRLELALAACRGLHLPLVHLGASGPSRRGLLHVPPTTPEASRGILAGASVLLLPSRYEPLGAPLLDALSLGVPFVACASGPSLDLASRSGCPLVLDHEDPEQCVIGLARGMDFLDQEPLAKEQLQTAAAPYDWNALLPRWHDLLATGSCEPWDRSTVSPTLVFGHQEPVASSKEGGA